MAATLDAWWSDLFASIDAKNSLGFVEFLSPDAEFRFGNAPAVVGRADIAAAVAGFFETIARSRHDIVRTWHDAATRVCQGEVTYGRRDGSEITLPFVNVFEMQGNKVARYSIYIDIAPLYAGDASG